MEIKLPSLGEGAGSGTVVKVLVSKGDQVEKDQALMEIESDKAVAELPSPEPGTIDEIKVKEGDEVSEGDLLVILSEGKSNGDDDSDDDETDEKQDDKPDEDQAKEEDEETPEPDEPEDDEGGTEDEEKPASGKRAPAAPSIRRMARELGIDLQRIGGSGRGDRIEIADLRAYIAQLEKRAERAAGGENARDLPETPDPSRYGEIQREPLSGIRKAIAGLLPRTWPNIPQVTQFGEADISRLMDLKAKHDKDFEKNDAKLTLTAILVKLLPPLLADHPDFNASLDLGEGAIIRKKYYHIGLAVDTDNGLLVPVMRDADEKSLADIAKEIVELAEAAREGSLDRKAMQGGSFTLSNQGGLGGGAFTPLVRYPESAILGVGRAVERPVLVDDSLESHPFLPLGLSYDHRLIDGGQAARFMADLLERLEEPDEAVFEVE